MGIAVLAQVFSALRSLDLISLRCVPRAGTWSESDNCGAVNRACFSHKDLVVERGTREFSFNTPTRCIWAEPYPT